MIRRYCYALLTSVLLAGTASADNTVVARWTDSNGTTHFGDMQFAPHGARELELGATNRMDVPTVQHTRRTARRANWVLIRKAPKRNKRGWRGYNRR